jgi:hypothetical protein
MRPPAHRHVLGPVASAQVVPGDCGVDVDAGEVPSTFATHVEEPAFGDGEGEFLATAVLWRGVGDGRWHAGTDIVLPPTRGSQDPDGSGSLAILLHDIVDRYAAFAADMYETEIDRTAVEHIAGSGPLTDVVVQALNPDATAADLSRYIAEIGYPAADG